MRDLTVRFSRGTTPVTVVDGVSLSLRAGRAHAVVGESGSGKSVSMRSLLRLLPDTARIRGSAVLRGDGAETELIGLGDGPMRSVRGRRIGMIFQNATDALNPTLTLETQLREPLLWHGICSKAEASKRAVAALADVGIPEPERRVKMYPFQLSGGMRQRAMIATAMIARPDILIADEPTTALDVTLQHQILDLLVEFKRRGTAIIMITHDLGVARYFCDDISVLYAGQVVEQGLVSQLLDAPTHPYTEGLLESVLEVDDVAPLHTIPGSPPDPAHLPPGCRFEPRCPYAAARCQEPQELRIGDGRTVRCWREDGHR